MYQHNNRGGVAARLQNSCPVEEGYACTSTTTGVKLPPDFKTLVLHRNKVEEGYVCTSTTKGVVFPPDECPKFFCHVGKLRGVYVVPV